MKRLLLTALTLGVMLLAGNVSALSASKIDHLVVFGDSLSDAGYMDNLPKLGRTDPAIDPNPNKRPIFTTPKGKIWAQYLSELLLHKQLRSNNQNPLVTSKDAYASGTETGFDFAAGGAVTEGTGVSRSPANYEPPSVQQQIATFVRQFGTVSSDGKTTEIDPNSLYIISDGADNFLRDFEEYSKQPLKLLVALKNTSIQAPEQILQDVTALQNAGAKHIIILGIGDLGKAPLVVHNQTLSQYMTQEAVTFNQNLQNDIALRNNQTRGLQGSKTQIMYYDTFDKMNSYIEHPEQNPIKIDGKQYHFTNVTESACQTLVSDQPGHAVTNHAPDALTCVPPPKNSFSPSHPTLYMFEDLAHPTTYAHLAVARDLVRDILADNSL